PKDGCEVSHFEFRRMELSICDPVHASSVVLPAGFVSHYPRGILMTTTQASQPSKKTLRKVVSASFIGTTVEYYDFFIYGTAAALVFPKIFFPELGGAAAVMASFATFGVAFVARPVGGIIFGHIGDRVGRKTTLVATLSLMGVATVLIGLLPPGSAIGVWAPIALIILRFAQGLAVGGEWASAAL